MKISDAIKSITSAPLPMDALEAIGAEVGVSLDDDISTTDIRAFYLFKAKTYIYLASLPNVSEGGVSISFNDSQRKMFLAQARRFAALAGVPDIVPGATYGYKGENL